jgi:transcriptional regulator with XRE-family HTH domain
MSEPEPNPSSEPDGEDQQAPRPEPAGLADERFAANIREERGRRKLSQGELARRMAERGFPYYQQTIRRIEEGRRKVSVGEAAALADIFGTTVDRLTWPGQVASAAWLLNTAMARADKAWNDIARRTRSLLYALTQLEHVAADLEKKDCLGSDKIREYVAEAAQYAEMNPEDAVAAGRGDYEAMTSEELEYKQAEEDRAEAAARGEGDERS